jgi:hypothetical protein
MADAGPAGSEDLGVLRDHRSAPVLLPINALRGTLSPRETPVATEHVRLLVDSIDRLPPISVHARSMAVIDGVHRVAAHRLVGRQRIAAILFDGDLRDALILAIRANVVHGLPLTLRERRQAAVQVLRAHPDRSDRWIATTCGLSHVTIGKIRHASSHAGEGQPRSGQDGRVRSAPSFPELAGEALEGDTPTRRESADVMRSRATSSLAPNPERLADKFDTRWFWRVGVPECSAVELAEALPQARLDEYQAECLRRAHFWSATSEAISERRRHGSGEPELLVEEAVSPPLRHPSS